MLMECYHYLQVWDAAQVLSANSDLVCLVHNRCAMFYMPLLIFPRPAITSQSKDNWQFMILLFHLMSQRGGFQATAWPRLRHTCICALKRTHTYAHTHNSNSCNIIRPQIDLMGQCQFRWTPANQQAPCIM